MTNRTAQRKQQYAKGSKGTQRGRASATRSRYPLIAIGVVVGIVIVMIGVSAFLRDPSATTPGGSTDGDTKAVVAAVTGVPASALDAVGAGEGIIPPGAIPATVPPVTSDGKPEVLYVGAEYCPYCAAERWPLVIALSRFGTFADLGLSTSSATDVFPSTPTVTFHGSTYTSDLISFVGVETNTNQPTASGDGYEPLDTLTAEQQQLLQTFNVPPYTPQAGSIPFLLIGNRFVVSGASYPPDVLQGKTWQQIADALSDPASPIAKQVLAAANMLTASICELTGGEPSNVCTASGVTSAAATLPSA
jgi:thiol-disulfide isomerase/thioredoxin